MRNQRNLEVLISLLMACGVTSCKLDAVGSSAKACSAGTVASCNCPANPALTTTCRPDGTGYQPCSCDPGGTAGQGQGGSASMMPGPGASGKPAAGGGGMSAPPSNGGPPATQTGGRSGSANGSAGTTVAGRSGDAGMNAAGTGASGGGASGTTGSTSSSETDMLRDTCVAEINKYRAMVSGLMPLKRASAAQEMCSDQGAQVDGDSMIGHGFFSTPGSCIQMVGLSAQDSCPGYPVGGFGGATVADSLKSCLQQMWAEGEPPQGRAACMSDTSCFQKYGHYLNMSNPKATAVSCAFYKMKDGMSWWMNQDFVVTWP